MIALDTNVLIYACDRSNPERQHTATQLIERTIDGVLLWQVACKFVAASRNQARFPLLIPSSGSLHGARELHLSRGVSFWDAMILAACSEAGIEILYSEDVPGLALGALRVINPFA